MERKYPRTYHLPSSPGLINDDKRLPDMSVFDGRRIIVTEKMDGEGTTMTPERTYPRSPDGRYHPSRDWMKAHHARRARDIPAGWRVSGEYLYARHSIIYSCAANNALRSYFYGFGVWDDTNVLLDWDQTLDVFAMIDVEPADILYDGPYSPGVLEELAANLDLERQEGFVVRDAGRIPYPSGAGDRGRFFSTVAKWVRPGHVQTDQHWSANWRDEPGFRNELRLGVGLEP